MYFLLEDCVDRQEVSLILSLFHVSSFTKGFPEKGPDQTDHTPISRTVFPALSPGFDVILDYCLLQMVNNSKLQLATYCRYLIILDCSIDRHKQSYEAMSLYAAAAKNT